MQEHLRKLVDEEVIEKLVNDYMNYKIRSIFLFHKRKMEKDEKKISIFFNLTKYSVNDVIIIGSRKSFTFADVGLSRKDSPEKKKDESQTRNSITNKLPLASGDSLRNMKLID